LGKVKAMFCSVPTWERAAFGSPPQIRIPDAPQIPGSEVELKVTASDRQDAERQLIAFAERVA
jgi:hypothetical protein